MMKFNRPKILNPLLMLAFLSLLLACSSVPSTQNYYVLGHSPQAKQIEVSGEPAMSIRYVNLPQYLSQQNMARKLANGQISLSYVDLWAEKLSQAIPSFLARELESQLQKPVILHPLPASYSVPVILELDIDEMIADDRQLLFSVRYRLLGEKKLLTYRFNQSVVLENTSEAALVKASEQALIALAADIGKHYPKT